MIDVVTQCQICESTLAVNDYLCARCWRDPHTNECLGCGARSNSYIDFAYYCGKCSEDGHYQPGQTRLFEKLGPADKMYDIQSGKVFVFGSNLGGRHGAGAALFAARYMGAVPGCGAGPMPSRDNPRCWGIPTKDAQLKTLPLEQIRLSVQEFIAFAVVRPDLEFFVTPVGCGLAGYRHPQIAPMFADAPPNCELPNGWRF